MNKKKILKLDQIKDFLLKKGFTVIKKKKINFLILKGQNNSFKSFCSASRLWSILSSTIFKSA